MTVVNTDDPVGPLYLFIDLEKILKMFNSRLVYSTTIIQNFSTEVYFIVTNSVSCEN